MKSKSFRIKISYCFIKAMFYNDNIFIEFDKKLHAAAFVTILE